MKIALILFLLASPALAQNKTDTTGALSACGPANVKFEVKPDQTQPLSEPPSGKALVYVIEDEVECLRAAPCTTIRIGLDGSWVGATHGNTHFSFSVLPGDHHLCSNWQSKPKDPSCFYSLANFTAEAGKVYYFRARVWTRLDLDPVNSDEGRYLVATSPLVISLPKK
jgi:hypothetical protein